MNARYLALPDDRFRGHSGHRRLMREIAQD